MKKKNEMLKASENEEEKFQEEPKIAIRISFPKY